MDNIKELFTKKRAKLATILIIISSLFVIATGSAHIEATYAISGGRPALYLFFITLIAIALVFQAFSWHKKRRLFSYGFIALFAILQITCIFLYSSLYLGNMGEINNSSTGSLYPTLSVTIMIINACLIGVSLILGGSNIDLTAAKDKD